MTAETNAIAVPWFRWRRAIVAVILGFVLPLPWPEVPVPIGLLIILFVAEGEHYGDQSVAIGGPIMYVLLVGLGLIYAAGLYVATTLWLLFREWRRWE